MTGALKPEEGSVLIKNKDISKISADELDEVKKTFGMLFQYSALLDSLTVEENVALPLEEHAKLAAEITRIIVKMKLSLVGLRGYEKYYPSQISGGMRKRVGLARAIALDPEILFFDEPTTGLDPITSGAIMSLINDLVRKSGATSVIVTQDMRCAFTCADRIALLHAGRVHALGTPEEIRASADPLVRQFINGEPDGPIPFRLSRDNCAEELRAPQRTKSGKHLRAGPVGPVASE